MTQTETRGLTTVQPLAALEHDRQARAIHGALCGRIEPVPGGWPLAWRAVDQGDIDAVRSATRLNERTSKIATYIDPKPVNRPAISVLQVDGEPQREAAASRAALGIAILAALLWGGVIGAALMARALTSLPR